jgi:Domain of unknown function (DUF6894)
MPRYFFHLSEPGAYSPDDLGVEFSGIEDAYLGAYQAALDMSIEMLRDRIDPARHSFEIADQAGEVLLELPFSEVMRPTGKLPRPGSIQASIQRQHERTLHAASDLKAALTRSRGLLQNTKSLLARLDRERELSQVNQRLNSG